MYNEGQHWIKKKFLFIYEFDLIWSNYFCLHFLFFIFINYRTLDINRDYEIGKLKIDILWPLNIGPKIFHAIIIFLLISHKS